MKQPYEFPYLLIKEIRDMHGKKTDWDKINQLIAELSKLHDQYKNLQYTHAGLLDDNQRLTHENQFMLKLIEKHGIGEK